jgi:hypothetical protein
MLFYILSGKNGKTVRLWMDNGMQIYGTLNHQLSPSGSSSFFISDNSSTKHYFDHDKVSNFTVLEDKS